jgi:hypothetical protein
VGVLAESWRQRPGTLTSSLQMVNAGKEERRGYYRMVYALCLA